MTDRGTDDGKIMLLSHTLAMRGSDVASLVEFRSVVWDENGLMHGRTDARKNNVALAHLYHEET